MAGRAKNLPRGVTWEERGQGYRVRIFYEGSHHSVGTFRTLGDARAALDIARSEKARGTFVSPAEKRRRRKEAATIAKAKAAADARTVRELFDAWLQDLERRGLKQGTVYTYQRRLEAHFMPTFQDVAVSSVSPDNVAAWLDDLEQQTSIATATPVHQAAAAMFRWAAGDATDLPRSFKPWVLASPVPPPAASRFRRAAGDAPERNRTPASTDDITEIADKMPAAERMAVLLAGRCALRLGEVLGLRRRHVITSTTPGDVTYWISVQSQVQARGSGVREESPKSRAGIRDIPVPAALTDALRDHLKEHAAKGRDGLLFPRHPESNVFHHPNTIRSHFNEALEAVNAPRYAGDDDRAPLENFTFHGLRHTALTRLGQAGATTAELKAYAGHSDGKSVERYQHAEKQRLASLVANIERNEL